jgi:glutamate synthase domain-containing protein 3
LVVRPPSENAPRSAPCSAIGNAAAYGATGGKLFVAGSAGQRLGVRNSGATLVTEGAGKYAFEYMTGGVGVILGPVGPVLGSGMTGGEVYVYAEDPAATVARLHAESVAASSPTSGELTELRAILEEHAARTGSRRATLLLGDWTSASRRFLKVAPVAAAAQITSPPPAATG